jgi:hypothetical protein
MSALLRLAETDPVAIASRDIEAGETLTAGDAAIVTVEKVRLGYKVALRPIEAGETVEKYRVPIGIATEAIAPGAVVHVHNLRSDYIPTQTL